MMYRSGPRARETTINAGDQKYLLVSPTFMIMKNQRFDNSTIKFYGSGECKVQTVEIYYYDKNGNKQKCSGNQYFNASANYAEGHSELKDKGTIVIGAKNSTTVNDFVPLSVKYIKIRVTCAWFGRDCNYQTVSFGVYPGYSWLVFYKIYRRMD